MDPLDGLPWSPLGWVTGCTEDDEPDTTGIRTYHFGPGGCMGPEGWATPIAWCNMAPAHDPRPCLNCGRLIENARHVDTGDMYCRPDDLGRSCGIRTAL